MDFRELELLAKRGDELPKQASPVDWFAYKALTELYSRFWRGLVGKQKASDEKKEIRERYTALCLECDRQAEAWSQYQAYIRKGAGYVHEMKTALESHAEASALILLSIKLYCSMVGEEVTEKAIKEKLEVWENGRNANF